MTRRDFPIRAAGLAGLLTGCQPEEKPVAALDIPARGREFHRGVNYTAERPDRYDSDGARQRLRALADYGVDSIALVPYGFNRRGSTDVRFNSRRSWEKDSALKSLTRVAHDAGMRVLLKPQLWVPRAFPGEIAFTEPTQARAWFASYEPFLRHYASLATEIKADLFCVGVEFTKLIQYEDDWRRLIRVTRDLYGGPLIYAANWGKEFNSVGFWDALDYMGLNNYYPLPDDLSMDFIVAEIERTQQRFSRPVIFPESGYPSLVTPYREPWAEVPREISLEEQARCYEAQFRAFYSKPWFHGVYWWKIGSNGFGGPHDGTHTPWRKPAMDVIAKWYRLGSQA